MSKHSFIVTIQTEGDVKARQMAKSIRLTLGGLKIWHDVPCGRESTGVKKVTVSNVGEK
jgi:hypothetical protein